MFELFKHKAGVNIVHVPYRGGGPMIADLIGGQVHATVNGKPVLRQHIAAGKVRALGVSAAKRGLEKLGIEPYVTTPAEFAKLAAEEAPRWGEAVRLTGIKVQ